MLYLGLASRIFASASPELSALQAVNKAAPTISNTKKN
jgi:hypothetical protein